MANLTKKMIMASYEALSHMHADKNAQGATQTVSALRYFFALDRFYKTHGRNCDTRNKEDKANFNKYVGEFCNVCDVEKKYTPQFYLPLKEHNGDFNIGSNFYSTGQVKVSLTNGGQIIDYPIRGNSPLFKIRNGTLIRNIAYYQNLLHYLPDNKIRLSLALWVCRWMNFDIDKSDLSGANLYMGLRDSLLNRYSQDLVNTLLPSEEEGIAILETFPISYTDKQPYVFSGKEIEAIFPEYNTPGNQIGKMIDPDTIPTDASYFSYLAAMRAKPFLLLAGISGTGKSRIVKEMAFASCPPSLRDEREVSPGNYCMVEVKPNWHDSTELLGYVSALQQKYVVTPFITFLIKAWMNPRAPFFVCLDEMNLAPVEQYFAEFLSVLESRKLRNGVIVSEALIKPDVVREHIKDFKEAYNATLKVDENEPKPYKPEVWANFSGSGISLPPNLIVVGTVNMDETTYQFSRKVIDRAMTIEMNEVDFDSMLSDDTPDTLKYLTNYVGAEYFLPKYAAARDAMGALPLESDRQLLRGEAVALLKDLDSVLKDTPFRVAYRVQNELVLYFAALREEHPEAEGASLLHSAIDDILMMKVLPRIQGGDELSEPLEAMQMWTANSFPKANAKIAEMQRGLGQKHFTSYWP